MLNPDPVLKQLAIPAEGHASVILSDLLAVMGHGIGDVVFASPNWVDATGQALSKAVDRWAEGLKDLGTFTFCEVAHNAPGWLHSGAKLAWYARFEGASVQVTAGELATDQCDLKIEGDHSILSNLGRIKYAGSDPGLVTRAQNRLQKLSRWKIHGKQPEHPVLSAVLRSAHDDMADRTMPRFVFMTPEWVSTARYIATTEAEKYADDLKDVVYTFAEEFFDTPAYAFPDGAHGGFWVHCNFGNVTVGAGPLPKALEPADSLTLANYNPVVPWGRDVVSALTGEEAADKARYGKTAFAADKETGKRPVEHSSPSGKGPMGPELGRVMRALHDELSKRTSGCLPADYDSSLRPEWSRPQQFDRPAGYDKSWLRYDEFDIYGHTRPESQRNTL